MIGMTIIRNNFKRKLSNKSSFIVILLVPIFVVILGVVANIASSPSFNIGIINQSPTAESEQAVNALIDSVGVEIENASLDTIKTDLVIGRYAAIIEFSDNDFIIHSIKDQQTIDTLSFVVEQYLLQSPLINVEELFETSLGIPQRICSFIVLFLMITATINASLITKDKNNGTLMRIKFSPCSAISYVTGNIVFNFLITYFQYFIAVSVIELMQLNTGISYGNYLVMGIWVTLLATAFGTCMTSLFNTEMQVNLFATCIATILSLIGGTFVAFESMPPMIQTISMISPVRWFIDNVNSMEQGQSWFANMVSISVLSIFIIVLFLLAILKNKKLKQV